MKISLIQTTSINDRTANLAQARELMEAALRTDRPDLLALPEVFAFRGGSKADKLRMAEDIKTGVCAAFLSEFARKNRVFIHGGSLLEAIPHENRVYNTTLVFDRDGQQIACYRKIHLFDVIAPDGSAYLESALVKAGDEIVTYKAEDFTFGCSICYDLRFCALFSALADRSVDAIFVPASFTLATGKDHWDVLLRARAIETQAYIIAPGQYGSFPDEDGSLRPSYGHSLGVDPWGHIVAKVSDGAGFASFNLNKAQIERVRGLIPMRLHKKPLV